jgi:hypothetical protein
VDVVLPEVAPLEADLTYLEHPIKIMDQKSHVTRCKPLEPETGEVRGEADGWARGYCAGQQRFYSESNQVQMNSNSIQFVLNFDQRRKDLPELKKIETKYGCERFEERNNFLHSNRSRFRMDFK